MDFEFTQEEKAFRTEVEEFFKKELPPTWDDEVDNWPGSYGNHPHEDEKLYDRVLEFLKKLGEKGWLTLGWPKEYDGGDSDFGGRRRGAKTGAVAEDRRG
jgi:3-oxocholest-4-en-26-oyl-CoA dehydrogenase alpha subunit